MVSTIPLTCPALAPCITNTPVHCTQTRLTVVAYLQEKGLFRGTHDNPMRLGISSRSKDVIEPVLKPQWWVACKGMADASCEAVHNGKLTIVPKVGGVAGGSLQCFALAGFHWLSGDPAVTYCCLAGGSVA